MHGRVLGTCDGLKGERSVGWANHGSHLTEVGLHLALRDSIIPLVKGSAGILTRGVLGGGPAFQKICLAEEYIGGIGTGKTRCKKTDVKGLVMEEALEIGKVK